MAVEAVDWAAVGRLEHPRWPVGSDVIPAIVIRRVDSSMMNSTANRVQSLATANAIESLISRTRHVKRNVKRWRGGRMVLRWTAAAILEAVKGVRRLKGHKDMPKLVAALRARDQ